MISHAPGRVAKKRRKPSTSSADGWPTRGLRWSGACEAGRASGRGTLRAYDGTRVVVAYYGRLEDGQLLLGVVERPDGFVAGRFEAGRVVNDGDRNTLIRAFDEASQAARERAERFRLAGNTASAAYYDSKSRQLAQQID